VLQSLIDWMPTDPVNLLTGLGAGGIAFAYFVLADLHGRRSKSWLEAPGPPSEAAIHYKYASSGGVRNLSTALLVIAVWLFEMWETRRAAFDLQKLAIIGLPTLLLLVLNERRRFRTRPAIAVYQGGILLDSWRGETMVPWDDVAYIETDPAESTGYRPNTHLRLVIGRKGGRRWRYSERDFGDEASSAFEMIIEVARRHVR
jgi:hypothetical protein